MITEDVVLRERFTKARDSVVKKFKANKRCLAAFLIGSVSHDAIWEWSDLQILVIFDDSYKGPINYYLMEYDVPVVINIQKKNQFKEYLGKTNVADYFFCALSKSTVLFNKDTVLQEYFEDIFYIGDRDREIEMLLGFSEAVYYLNKAEKNFRVKHNTANSIDFLVQLAHAIAWIEVAKARLFPEREIIDQASLLKPDLFSRIYDQLYSKPVMDTIVEDIINACYEYLKSNTEEVYRPIISYLEKNGSLKDFSMKTRDHGFGIDFLWLYRMGIVDMESEPIKIDNQLEEFYQINHRYKRSTVK